MNINFVYIQNINHTISISIFDIVKISIILYLNQFLINKTESSIIGLPVNRRGNCQSPMSTEIDMGNNRGIFL